MDGSDVALYPFLPYILQDIWELGSDPEIVIALIRKHVSDPSCLKVLDLGCGKGAVSIRIAKAVRCICVGIDAVEGFIDEAKTIAKEYGVQQLCQFEVGDIREKVKSATGFNVIILGSIGPVFGDYFQTLVTLEKCIVDDGLILIDDGYIQNNSTYSHPYVSKRAVILKQVSDAGMRLIDEFIIGKDSIKKSDDMILGKLETRCKELIEKYPEKSHLFNEYLKRQKEENAALEGEIVCATMIIKKVKN
jgi:cyclopropane fatty-acyl-phospholipid synthase-like methyltransferase